MYDPEPPAPAAPAEAPPPPPPCAGSKRRREADSDGALHGPDQELEGPGRPGARPGEGPRHGRAGQGLQPDGGVVVIE